MAVASLKETTRREYEEMDRISWLHIRNIHVSPKGTWVKEIVPNSNPESEEGRAF
jgi:hypothetical protein